MLNININGSRLNADLSASRTMGDLIEAVKTRIDPDTIIIDISFNGQSLNDSDWNLPISQHNGKTLEICTGSRQNFMMQRLALSPEIAGQIINNFSDAALSYKNGLTLDGNQLLQTAVGDLDAFIRWYSSVLAMAPSAEWKESFHKQVAELQKACEQIFQQQLYNSWWVLAETINNRLRPSLEEVKKLCERLATEVGAPN